jgi:hypothetical protein
MNRRIHKLIASRGCALVALAAAIAPGAFAQQPKRDFAEYIVNKISDGAGPGTLRQALAAANANQGGTIRFANGLAGTILLTSGELRITANVAIGGPGADTLTISGNNASRVFTIESPPGGGPNEVTISGLTITGGFAGDGAVPPGKGGGIYVQGTALTLSEVVIANNVVVGPLGGIGEGGGLYANAGAVTISNSTISGNQVVGSDSVTVNGVAMGGALAADGGRLTLDGNIFAGNQAIGGSALGGAIAFTGNTGDTVTIDGNAISGNQAQANTIGGSALGGGLFVSGKVAQVKGVVRGTRLVGNIAQRSSRGGASGGASLVDGSSGSSLGGGLYVGNLASVVLAQVLVSFNTSDTYSGLTVLSQSAAEEN